MRQSTMEVTFMQALHTWLPAGAPENASAQCNDGTFSMAKEHRGACSGHKGVKAWFK